MAKVLLIEDDAGLREILKFNLSRSGYDPIEAESAQEALLLLEDIVPDLILLDLMLPGLKGEDFLNIIRNNEKLGYIPVVVISAKSEENKVVELLKSGADDYLTKPFSIKILLSKIEVLLKRMNIQKKSIKYGNVEVFVDKHTVTIDGEPVKLTHTEFELLSFMLRHPNVVFTRAQLLSNVWGYDADVYTRTVDAHISSLRKKLKKANFSIKSVPKVGYKVE